MTTKTFGESIVSRIEFGLLTPTDSQFIQAFETVIHNLGLGEETPIADLMAGELLFRFAQLTALRFSEPKFVEDRLIYLPRGVSQLEATAIISSMFFQETFKEIEELGGLQNVNVLKDLEYVFQTLAMKGAFPLFPNDANESTLAMQKAQNINSQGGTLAVLKFLLKRAIDQEHSQNQSRSMHKFPNTILWTNSGLVQNGSELLSFLLRKRIEMAGSNDLLNHFPHIEKICKVRIQDLGAYNGVNIMTLLNMPKLLLGEKVTIEDKEFSTTITFATSRKDVLVLYKMAIARLEEILRKFSEVGSRYRISPQSRNSDEVKQYKAAIVVVEKEFTEKYQLNYQAFARFIFKAQRANLFEHLVRAIMIVENTERQKREEIF